MFLYYIFTSLVLIFLLKNKLFDLMFKVLELFLWYPYVHVLYILIVVTLILIMIYNILTSKRCDMNFEGNHISFFLNLFNSFVYAYFMYTLEPMISTKLKYKLQFTIF